LPPDDSGVDWQELYLSDELDSVKVPHLKSFLRSQGAPLSGNKAALLSRVTDLIKATLATSSSDAKVKLEV
jgi:SAP domain